MLSAEKIYFHSPVAIQNLFVSLYGSRLKRERYGTHFKATFRKLMRSQNHSWAELKIIQAESLSALIEYARSNVPNYRESLKDIEFKGLEDLRQLPVLEKAELVRNFRGFTARTIPEEDLLWISTSGTTGTPLLIPVTKHARQENYAFFERFKTLAGLEQNSRAVVFGGRVFVKPEDKRGPFWRRNYFGNSLLCSSYHLSPATLSDYYKAIQKFSPEYIDSYPSSVYLLARYIVDNELPRIALKAVITSSETLLDNQRAVIEEAFKCKVFDYYGNAEQAAFISQCQAGSYHVQAEFGIVEFVKPGTAEEAAPGELAEMLCTGFTNRALPLIRYRVGDLAEYSDEPCSCGSAMPRVSRIEGRTDDSIRGADGRLFGRLDPVFKGVSEGIVEAQIIQDSLEQLTLRLVPGETYVEEIADEIVEEIHKRTGRQFQIVVEEMELIPRETNGKFRSVKSLLQR